MSTILLVEDNKMNRDMLSRRLSRYSYNILLAVDGEQGVRMTEEEMPDLVLMDISLPVIDGLEATRRIRGNDRTRDIPIIGLSAHAMSEDRARALDAGCDDYDTKPVDIQRLQEKIEQWLVRRESGA